MLSKFSVCVYCVYKWIQALSLSTVSVRFLTVSIRDCEYVCAVWTRIRMRSIVALNCYAACSCCCCCCCCRNRLCTYSQYWLSVCATVLVHIVYYSLRFCLRLLLYSMIRNHKTAVFVKTKQCTHTDANAHCYNSHCELERRHILKPVWLAHIHKFSSSIHTYSPR